MEVYNGMTADEVADAYTAECKCGYEDGTGVIQAYLDAGLELKEKPHNHIEGRRLSDTETYTYEFRPIKDSTCYCMLKGSWHSRGGYTCAD